MIQDKIQDKIQEAYESMLNEGESKEYSDKWINKMSGSPLSTALEWVDGTDLTDKQKKDVLYKMIKAKSVKKSGGYDKENYSWAKGMI